MFSETADFYDLLYSFKNYSEEAKKIKDLIRREHPGARTILDVACGTAEHAKLLIDDFNVDGIDLDPRFIEIAQAKVPAGRFSVADMRSFELSRRYDVVQCLFSSIGYLLTPQDILSAFRCFRRHLNPGGIILIEPWLTPDAYKTGRPHMLVAERPDIKICRMNSCQLEGNVSILHFHYLICTAKGVRHCEEIHRLAMFTVEQLTGFFREAGLAATFDPVGLFGRGLFIAREKS
jgi:SAM-dependent methyltransferase